MRSRIRVVGALVAAFVVLVPAAALANNAWNGYHWPGAGPRQPTVVNNSGGFFDDGFVQAAVDEWRVFGAGAIEPSFSGGSSGDVEVLAKRGSARWIGLARIWVDELDHILRGQVVFNLLYAGLDEKEEDHVVCQELGHVWGLDHNRAEWDTCMNDQATLGDATAPNEHDSDQLVLIYGHADGLAPSGDGDSGSGGGPRPGCGGNGKSKKCNQGQWVTVHVFWAPQGLLASLSG